MGRISPLILGWLLWLAFISKVAAAPISIGGLTFSDELGGFSILAATGSGTIDNPFVVIEELDSLQDAVLVIRGLAPNFGNRIGTQHLTGFALKKVVINRTGSDWNLFTIELRKHLDLPSSYGDGLSFGQGSPIGRPFTSNAFAASDVTDEPYDSILFRNGVVQSGKQSSFVFVITDTSPVSPFFLLQTPTRMVAGFPHAWQAARTCGRRHVWPAFPYAGRSAGRESTMGLASVCDVGNGADLPECGLKCADSLQALTLLAQGRALLIIGHGILNHPGIRGRRPRMVELVAQVGTAPDQIGDDNGVVATRSAVGGAMVVRDEERRSVRRLSHR